VTNKKIQPSAGLFGLLFIFAGLLATSPSIRPGGRGNPADSSWLKGYARTIAGETMGYHSPYPEATAALIVRATDGTMAIEWETEPVPAGFDAPFATFIWMCGLGTGKGAHRFDLSIDGKPAFAFHSAKDETERTWELKGPGGAALSFRTTLVDQFKELFGFMFLKVPRSWVRPSQPLRLRVTGENGGSRDWHMVFPYDLQPFIKAAGEPALVRKNGRLLQLVRIAVSHIAPPARAVLTADGGSPVAVDLETGYNTIYLPVEPAAKPRETEIVIVVAGRPAIKKKAALRPVARRTFYLLPHSHNDIGYSDLQVKIEKDQWSYLEQAVELARRTASYPYGARFKWNTEILWAVESYLRQATPAKREAFIAAVRDGQIGLQALLANELTGTCSPDELFESTAYARRLAHQYGLTINTAMLTDIPSYTWSLVPALAQTGVKYFSSGPNYMPDLTDGGDRIGGSLKAWGDKPVYWLSPSGREKILFWMAGRGYSWFHGLNMGRLTGDKKEAVFNYCRELEEKAYPYEIVQVRYTIGGDNGPPDPDLPDVVRRWNEEIETPKLVIATAQEMFEDFEKRHGQGLPSAAGDFTPYWEDGAASSARETGLNRAAAARLVQAETLWAMLDPAGYPASDFDEAWRQTLMWDEHTWGAADSVSDPDGENARTQWAYKQAFALESEKRSLSLMRAALDRPQPPAADSFAVLNTCSWARSGVVSIPAEMSAAGEHVVDEAGRPAPSQRLSTGELAVWAESIPPFGGRRFYIRKEGPAAAGIKAFADGTSLDNGRIAVTIETRTGTVSSFRWKRIEDAELVDRTQEPGLNGYYYVPGRDPKTSLGVRGAVVTVKEMGPVVAVLRVVSAAPGCASLVREYRITAGSDRLEILDILDKSAVRDKEAVHIAFPFRVPEGTLRLDLGWAWVRPEIDQLAGSCKDFFGLQNAADISGGRYGLTWVSLDAPLMEIGVVTDETRGAKGVRVWKTSVSPSQRLYSYALNNYWHTNYKAEQEGALVFRYAVEPHVGADLGAAKRIGLDAERPLIVAPAAAALRGADPILRIGSPDVVITSLRPSRDGRGFVARLYNASLRPVETAVAGRSGTAIFLSDPDDRRGAPLPGPLILAPAEIVTLRIEKKD
jgi:alpha-mannosidase